MIDLIVAKTQTGEQFGGAGFGAIAVDGIVAFVQRPQSVMVVLLLGLGDCRFDAAQFAVAVDHCCQGGTIQVVAFLLHVRDLPFAGQTAFSLVGMVFTHKKP